MAHDERVGLVTVPGGAGIVPSWLDARQWILAGAAARRVLCALLDGPGVYSGGAAELADLTGGGTLYPAFLAMVADDSAEVWPAGSGGTSAITFNVAGTAAGDARLYLVVSKLAGVSPAAAAGNLGGYTLVADDVANPPPADSLLLGSGTLAASAFTAYTPAAGVLRLGYIPLVDPAVAGHLVQLLADGTLEDAGLSLGDFYTQAEIDALLADLFTVAADTGDPQTVGLGDVVSVSGLPGATQTVEAAGPTTTVKLAQLPLLGPPASDDPYAPGDLVEDAAGAQFVAQSTGSGGGITGWQQLTGGTLPIDSIDSPPEAADFNPGSIHPGYWYNDAVYGFPRIDAPPSIKWPAMKFGIRDTGDNYHAELVADNLVAARTFHLPEVGADPVVVCAQGTQTLTGVYIFANGQVRIVRDAKFGSPTAAAVAGDRWWDLAGAEWLCTTSGTPGTWVQIHPGLAATWSGGGAADIETASNWNGGSKLDGYRVHEPGAFDWVYSSNGGSPLNRWLSAHTIMHPVSITAVTLSAAPAVVARMAMGDTWDYFLIEWSVYSNANATTDGSNYYDLVLQAYNTAESASADWSSTFTMTTQGAAVYHGTGSVIFDSSTYTKVIVRSNNKVGSPGTNSVAGTSVHYRLVRK